MRTVFRAPLWAAVLPVSLFAFLPAAHANGAPSAYTSQASFTQAVSGGTVITFADLAPSGGYTQYSASAPLKIGGVTFNGQSVHYKDGVAQTPTTVSYAKDQNESDGKWQVDGTDSYLGGGTYTPTKSDYYLGTVTLDFDQAYTAWGANIGVNRDAAQTVQISLYNGSTLITQTASPLALSYNPASPQYIGFAGSQGFNRVIISGLSGSPTANANNYLGSFTLLDNVRVAHTKSPSAVPEPGVWVSALSLVGVTSLGLVRGRRRAGRRG